MSEHCSDHGQRHAGLHGDDAEGVPQSSRARLGTGDAGALHELVHLACCGLPGDGPERSVSSSRTRLSGSEAVHEIERLGDTSGTGTALQCSLRRFSVTIRISFAARSTSQARMLSASLTRHPVIASVRARYFRPRASTRLASAVGGMGAGLRCGAAPECYISLGEMPTVAVFPAFSGPLSLAIAAGPGPSVCREMFPYADFVTLRVSGSVIMCILFMYF